MQEALLYNILMQSDIDSIVQLSLVSKHVKNLTDKQFWINKFENDKLPLFNQHVIFNDWVNEYKRTLAAKEKAVKFVQLLFIEYDFRNQEHHKYGYVNEFKLTATIRNIKNRPFYHLLPDALKNQVDESLVDASEGQALTILLKNNVFSIHYTIVPKNRQFWYTNIQYNQILTQEELIDTLLKLFYVYDIDILDQEEMSYFTKSYDPSVILRGKPLELLANRIAYWNK